MKVVPALATVCLAATLLASCGKSTPTEPIGADLAVLGQSQSARPAPATIAEARQRQAEVAMPTFEDLAPMFEELLRNKPTPTEQDVLAATWPTMREMRLSGQSSYKNFNGLPFTTEEYYLLVAYPKYFSTTWGTTGDARKAAENAFPGDQYNTKADAFRHAYWNCILAKRVAIWWATAFTLAHESETADGMGKRMDLNNNEVGQWIFINNKTASESTLASKVKKWTYVYVTTLKKGESRKDLVYYKK